MEDLADAIYFLIRRRVDYDFLNIGTGEDVSIKDLAYMIKKTINYTGKIIFNRSYPDGVKKRMVNSKRIRKMGWKPKIKLKNGLNKFCKHYSTIIFPKEKSL